MTIKVLEQRRNHRLDWNSYAFWGGLALLILLMSLWIGSRVAAELAQEKQERARIAFEEQTGIRLLRVALTANGGMVVLQYQIVDPDKSLIVHDDEKPPTLLDEASRLVIATPFHDHSFRELHTAVTYHELIMNGGGLLQRGSTVTLLVGDSRLEHIVVE